MSSSAMVAFTSSRNTVVAVVTLLALFSAHCVAVNNRPVIGILTLPCTDSDCQGKEYFPASYVKYLEAGGAQVVPIRYTSTASEITLLLSFLNGALFTGGGASLAPDSEYFHAVETIYNYSVDATNNGDNFPLWGTCLGFQSLMRAQSQDPNVLSATNSENYTVPLNFTSVAGNSRIFNYTHPSASSAFQILSSRPITMNNHHWGVYRSTWETEPRLNQFFDLLATNHDRNGNEFVSLVQGKKHPIYGSQFHPEKPTFEWYPDEVIQHTKAAVFANQYLAQFFVDECRSSAHAFPNTETLTKSLIYNYQAVYTNTEFVQCYYF